MNAASASAASGRGETWGPAALGVSFALDACDRMFAEHLEAAERRFGACVFGLAALPPLTGGTVEPDQLRVVPALFWASEVEEAGLLPTLEALSEGVLSGTVPEPQGQGSDLLFAYHRARRDRFTPEERRAVFSHLFGGPGSPDPNDAFPSTFEALVDALANIGLTGTQYSTTGYEMRATSLASDLAQGLSPRSAGVTAFAARDIVANIREALRILQNPDVAMTYGGGSPWTLVERLAQPLLGRTLAPRPHVQRATAGIQILQWCVDHATSIEGGSVSIQRTDPVVQAAEQWVSTRVDLASAPVAAPQLRADPSRAAERRA
jgi:hypothetical protein